ncbi:MAG: hypothetical protein HY317_05310 [Acidobacteria bacterium]|nr:hypothetical protein [Acidobacteriota bacterium]
MPMNRNTSLTLTLTLLGALALSHPAAAGCLTTGDFDGDGRQDMLFKAGTGKNTLVVVSGPTETTVTLDCNGDGDFADASDLNAQVFSGDFHVYDVQLGGADTITFNVPSNWSAISRSVQLVLGPGTNNVHLTTAGGAVLQAGSRLQMEVVGYLQYDRVNLTTPGLDASSFLFRADLSSGNDDVDLTLGGDVTGGSVLDVDAVLSVGSNTFDFLQAGKTVDASTLLIHVEGAGGVERVTSSLNGTISGAARMLFTAELGGGSDLYTGTVDLAAFDLTGPAEARFEVAGGVGSDILSFTRNGTSGGASTTLGGLLDVRLTGGTGNDKLTVDLAGGGFSIDGGTLGAWLDSGASDDKLDVFLEAASSSTNPNFDVHVNGGGQNDTITFSLLNGGPNTAANYGPAGAAFVDGGAGNNKCPITGTGIVHRRNCQ